MDTKAKRKKPGRPVAPVRRERVTLTIHPNIRRMADRLAFQTNRSLSGLVEYALKQTFPEITPESAQSRRARSL